MDLRIQIKPLVVTTLAFILVTIVGTISHEYGHYIVAKSLDYQPTLHFASTSYSRDKKYDSLSRICENDKTEAKSEAVLKKQDEYKIVLDKLKRDSLLVTSGGPIQTMLTSFLGLFILLFRKRKIQVNGLTSLDWIAIFLALFCLREVFNLGMSVTNEVIAPNGSYFGGDELKIAQALNLWNGTISLGLGLVGFLISSFIIFSTIPRHLRLTFVISGLIGGSMGFILWMKILGPFLLP